MEQLTPEEMDANAVEAQAELTRMIEESFTGTEHSPILEEIAYWWSLWRDKCGHKRLGRIVMKFIPEVK